ncbi:MAG: hypothetical protein ACP5PV_07255 [Methanothrix sp.]
MLIISNWQRPVISHSRINVPLYGAIGLGQSRASGKAEDKGCQNS